MYANKFLITFNQCVSNDYATMSISKISFNIVKL